MDYNSTRSFTMTLAHRAVGDIRRGGFRQLRNYVDMCATLAKNQQQKDFFAYAQKALQRTDSCYYSLIHRLLDSVDEDRICTVGVNMGFGGLIYGASELKKQADLEGQPIAWITAARCGDERLSELVPKAARHGSFVWLLDATDTDPAQVVLLAKANPQSAFGLLADPSALTEDCVKTLAACRNLVVMPLLQTPARSLASAPGFVLYPLYLLHRREGLRGCEQGPRLSGAKPGCEQCLPLRGKQPHERVCEANWRRSLCAAKR